jgi:hypothetical protein
LYPLEVADAYHLPGEALLPLEVRVRLGPVADVVYEFKQSHVILIEI